MNNEKLKERVGISAGGLAFRDCGDKAAPALFLVNSIGLSSKVWDAQKEVFSARFRTVLYDPRGHGESKGMAPARSIAELGNDLLELADELGIRRFSVCGLSLGGLVAIWVAAHAPDRIERIVVACSSAHPNDAAKWTARIEQARAEGMRQVVERGSAGWFTPEFAVAHADLLAQLRDEVTKCDVEGYAGCCEALRDADLRPDLPGITAPTLVVAGAQDRGFPLPHAKAIADGIPGSRLVVLEHAAHFACVEKPEQFNQACLAHFS
jgi:3-oxoadipate enol-lactonase